MKKEQLKFAILVPKSLAELDFSSISNEEVEVTGSIVDSGTTEQSLDFDLAQTGDLAWYTFNLIGIGTTTVALNMISNLLSDKLKEYRKDKNSVELVIRLPNGSRLRMSSSDENLIEKLKKELEDQLD